MLMPLITFLLYFDLPLYAAHAAMIRCAFIIVFAHYFRRLPPRAFISLHLIIFAPITLILRYRYAYRYFFSRLFDYCWFAYDAYDSAAAMPITMTPLDADDACCHVFAALMPCHYALRLHYYLPHKRSISPLMLRCCSRATMLHA